MQPYTDRSTVKRFDARLSTAFQRQINVGDSLKGEWSSGASFRLPSSGDGGEILDYGRQGHPGGRKVEEILEALEMGQHALCFSDGMRAIAASVQAVVRPGDTVLVHNSMYGGTLRYFNRLKSWGVNVQSFDLGSEDADQKIKKERPKLVVLESVTNPLLEVLNMPKLMSAAVESGSFMAIDNTLATAYSCLPLVMARRCRFEKLMVVLSLTKGYTAGELGGAVVTDSDDIRKRLFELRQAEGGNASPNDVSKFHEGMKSMGVRMERLSANTSALLRLLRKRNDAGIQILHPSQRDAKCRALAEKVLLRDPALLTLECKLPTDQYADLVGRLADFFLRSNSFNGHFPQLSESARQSHASVKDETQKARAGISAQLLRLSPSSMMRPKDLAREFDSILVAWKKQKFISLPL